LVSPAGLGPIKEMQMLHLLLPLPQANAIDILSTKKVHQACKSDSKTNMGKK